MPMVRGSEFIPYTDTPEPRCFATVSPLDPVLFATIETHAADEMALASESEILADRGSSMDGGLRYRIERRAGRGTQQDSGAAIGCLSPNRSGCGDSGRAGRFFASKLTTIMSLPSLNNRRTWQPASRRSTNAVNARGVDLTVYRCPHRCPLIASEPISLEKCTCRLGLVD